MGVGDKHCLEDLTTDELAQLVNDERRLVVLLPVGSVEPHGPHLPLATDTVISRAAAEFAVRKLSDHGVIALIAPAIPFGVTECARAFAGAVSVGGAELRAFLRSAVEGLLGAGADHVCLVNNHLEPEHDASVRASVEGLGPGEASVASPLTRRWARTLDEEFKSGACHAGMYETSIVMAADPDLVREDRRRGLEEVPVSLSDQLANGVSDFVEMGLAQSYAGSPAAATSEHGQKMIACLGEMITTEIVEALEK